MERTEIKKFFKTCEETDKYFTLLVESDVGEKHHILPESIWPEFAKCGWNLVRIPFENHYKVHEILPFIVGEEHKKPMAYAWRMMCGRTKGRFIDASKYRELAELRASVGYPASDKQRRKQSETMKGRPSPFKGLDRPELKGKMVGEKNPMARAVIIDGTEYATLTEAAERFGITKQAILYWIKTGRAIDKSVGTKVEWKDGRASAVIVKGIEFATIKDACLHFDVTTTTIRNWVKRGLANYKDSK